MLRMPQRAIIPYANVVRVLEELMPVMPDLLVMLLSCHNGKLLIKRAAELDSYNSIQCRQVCAFFCGTS